MRVGRPPLPKALHELHGNPSRKKLDAIEEPKTRGPLGPPPSWLDDDARTVWLELEAVMPVAVLAYCDMPLVASYCTAVARHREAVVRLRESGGAVIGGDGGTLVLNPWQRVLDRQAVLILRFGSELALTPTARASMASRIAAAGGSIATPERRRESALDRYLAAKPDKLEPN
jgi:P27 family predicted phage terminase small subunit